jgi:hypothetical protein
MRRLAAATCGHIGAPTCSPHLDGHGCSPRFMPRVPGKQLDERAARLRHRKQSRVRRTNRREDLAVVGQCAGHERTEIGRRGARLNAAAGGAKTAADLPPASRAQMRDRRRFAPRSGAPHCLPRSGLRQRYVSSNSLSGTSSLSSQSSASTCSRCSTCAGRKRWNLDGPAWDRCAPRSLRPLR